MKGSSMYNKSFNFWKNKEQSLNRESSPEYYRRKSAEIYSVISFYDKSLGLIDFGCGAGELLHPLSQKLNCNITAVDYSESMLKAARERVKSENVFFECQDALDFSEKTDVKSTIWMSCGAANQYSCKRELVKFINNFLRNPHTKQLLLFDTIDPLQYILFNAGIIFSYSPRRKGGFLKRTLELFKNLLVYKAYKLIVPLSVGMGYGVKKSFWRQEFITTNIEVKILSSMYFEYRYHVVLEKK